MKTGDIVLIRLAQISGGPIKLRPALILSLLPGPYQNVLICGISTQLQTLQPNWDELLDTIDPDFAGTGLHRKSSVRLSYLYAADSSEIVGTIGSISAVRLGRLRSNLRQNLL